MSGFEERNKAFTNAQTDMQMVWIEAERENKQLKELANKLYLYYLGALNSYRNAKSATCSSKERNRLNRDILRLMSTFDDKMQELGISKDGVVPIAPIEEWRVSE